MRRLGRILLAAGVIPAFFVAPRRADGQTVGFSGYTWNVKSSSGKVGPGPNYFSASPSNVWVDAGGRLHLKITKNRNRWSCAEVVNAQTLGYGTYRFYLDSAVDTLDPGVVLGLFTWSDPAPDNHREIDIEFSRWGSATNQNSQYVVQPYSLASNIHRFNVPAGNPQSTHSFLWQPASVAFQSLKGLLAAPTDSSSILQQWTETNGVPASLDEHARMNLWLYQGRAPRNGLPAEVVVNRFEFAPAP